MRYIYKYLLLYLLIWGANFCIR